MISQINFPDAGYAGRCKQIHRYIFHKMKVVMPRKALIGRIQPYYPLAERGCRSYLLELRPRVHLKQTWFAWCAPAIEAALCANTSLLALVHLGPCEANSDETTNHCRAQFDSECDGRA